MVEHSIQDDLHSTGLSGLDQGLESHLSPQILIYPGEIGGVIAMVGGGAKDGVEVEDVDPQRVKVARLQLLADPFQIASIEIVASAMFAGVFLVGVTDGSVPGCSSRAQDAAPAIVRAARRAVVFRISITEAIREDLVDDASLKPSGGLEVWIINADPKALLELALNPQQPNTSMVKEIGMVLVIEALLTALLLEDQLKEILKSAGCRGFKACPPPIQLR